MGIDSRTGIKRSSKVKKLLGGMRDGKLWRVVILDDAKDDKLPMILVFLYLNYKHMFGQLSDC